MATEHPIISADDPIEGPYKGVNIVIVKEKHHAALLKHIKEIFCRDEPFCKSVGTEEYSDGIVEYIKRGLDQNNGQCLVALDPKTGEVAGCRLSKVVEKDVKEEVKKTSTLPEIFKQIMQLIYVDLNAPVKNVYEMFNVDKLVEYRALSVADNYRQMGLGYEMLLRSLRLAKKDGLTVVRGVFTSKYSRKAAENLGFKTYNEIFYKEYKVNGKVLLENMDPHPSVVVSIKQL